MVTETTSGMRGEPGHGLGDGEAHREIGRGTVGSAAPEPFTIEISAQYLLLIVSRAVAVDGRLDDDLLTVPRAAVILDQARSSRRRRSAGM